jgi:hypothetical protein
MNAETLQALNLAVESAQAKRWRLARLTFEGRMTKKVCAGRRRLTRCFEEQCG